ncbi:MAG TPA: hypothetical protein VHW23_24300 [Kofleriaceae bacterium]|jgi:hypothetical protein|nr:hypothetical protein [Kofleriaceae bacterium]
MARVARAALAALAGFWALGSSGRRAAADGNDLVMSRLATRITDDTGRVLAVVGQNLEFRALASQLGVVLAPHLLSPADTLGFGGFQFDVDVSQTSIDSVQPYWRVLAGTRDPSGANHIANGAGVLRTVGWFARKGLWLPVPSLELGAGAVHLLGSTIWAAQVYAKIAVHEGFHELPIPSIAIRGAVSRMMNQRDLDLTIGSLDITLSRHLGIAGTWRLDPFLGYNLLIIVPRSQVIDATPDVDPLAPGNQMDVANNFVFHDQAAITRHRFLLGAKAQYSVLQITLEAQYALAGSSVDSRPGVTQACQPSATTTSCNAKDTAAGQTTVSLSAGFDF